MSFLKNFTKAFNKSNLSQAELSRLTNIPKSNIHDYLKGKYTPKTNRIRILAKALNVDPIWLSGEDEEKHDLKNMHNLYVDNKLVTDDEIKKIIDYIRLLRMI